MYGIDKSANELLNFYSTNHWIKYCIRGLTKYLASIALNNIVSKKEYSILNQQKIGKISELQRVKLYLTQYILCWIIIKPTD